MRTPLLAATSLRTLIVAAVLVLGASASSAEVVRCLDANGATVYTDGACPSGTRSSRPVQIAEPPPPSALQPAPPARAPDYAPPPTAAAPAPPSNPGLSIIPRYPDEGRAAQADPEPVYLWGPDPYAYPPPPRRRVQPPPPHVHDPGPGRRPCAHMAGLRRNNC